MRRIYATILNSGSLSGSSLSSSLVVGVTLVRIVMKLFLMVALSMWVFKIGNLFRITSWMLSMSYFTAVNMVLVVLIYDR